MSTAAMQIGDTVSITSASIDLKGYPDLPTAYRMAMRRVGALRRTKADAATIAEAVTYREMLASAMQAARKEAVYNGL